MTGMRDAGTAGMRLGAALAAIAVAAGLAQDPKAGTEAKPGGETNRVVVALTDGSRIVCVPEVDKVPFETSYAAMTLPLAKLKSITFDRKEKGQADVVLRNGDKLRGKISLESLKVKALFGDHAIALAHVESIVSADPDSAEKTVIQDTPQNRARCINNLRLMDHAKEVLAIKNGLVSGAQVTLVEISPYIDGGSNRLKCPSGGTYKLNPIDKAPECSVPGHKYEVNQ
jgi:hypothetical protein